VLAILFLGYVLAEDALGSKQPAVYHAKAVIFLLMLIGFVVSIGRHEKIYLGMRLRVGMGRASRVQCNIPARVLQRLLRKEGGICTWNGARMTAWIVEIRSLPDVRVPRISLKFPVRSTYAGGPKPGDAFISELGPNGSLSFSTYLGGSNDDAGYAIAADSSGDFMWPGGPRWWISPWSTGCKAPMTERG
jgi:hypothetical protein